MYTPPAFPGLSGLGAVPARDLHQIGAAISALDSVTGQAERGNRAASDAALRYADGLVAPLRPGAAVRADYRAAVERYDRARAHSVSVAESYLSRTAADLERFAQGTAATVATHQRYRNRSDVAASNLDVAADAARMTEEQARHAAEQAAEQIRKMYENAKHTVEEAMSVPWWVWAGGAIALRVLLK